MEELTYSILDVHVECDTAFTGEPDAEITSKSENDEIAEICRLATELANPDPISFTTT